MPKTELANLALSDAAARQLANATKTTAQLDTITPRWLVRLLQWVPVEAGIYRLNRVVHPEDVEIACPPRDESELPQTYVGTTRRRGSTSSTPSRPSWISTPGSPTSTAARTTR